ALLPDPPMDQDRNRVKVPSEGLGDLLSCCQPPIFSTAEIVAGSWEVLLCPSSKPQPHFAREAAQHEEVGVVLIIRKTEGAGLTVRPPPSSKIVRSKASLVHHQPHEKFALHRS